MGMVKSVILAKLLAPQKLTLLIYCSISPEIQALTQLVNQSILNPYEDPFCFQHYSSWSYQPQYYQSLHKPSSTSKSESTKY